MDPSQENTKKPSHSVLDSHSSHHYHIEKEDLPSSSPSEVNSPKPPPSSQPPYILLMGAKIYSSPSPSPSQQEEEEELPSSPPSGVNSPKPPPSSQPPATEASTQNITPPQKPLLQRKQEPLTHKCECYYSRCLRRWCSCFSSGSLCNGCNCFNCHNNLEDDSERIKAIEKTLKRNPKAFKSKIDGCNCKKSGCLQKYCTCFGANVVCLEKCKCQDCKNFEGSEERYHILHGHKVSDTNAALTRAIGSWKPSESRQRKDSHSAASQVVQPHHAKELSSILVSKSMNVAKKFADDERRKCDKDPSLDQAKKDAEQERQVPTGFRDYFSQFMNECQETNNTNPSRKKPEDDEEDDQSHRDSMFREFL